MKKTALTLAFIFLTAGATAHSFDLSNLESDNLDHYQEEINMYSDEVPSFLESLVGDQTINVNIDSNGTETSVGVIMNGTTVEDMQMGGYENATFRVNTSETQINNITTSENPVQRLNTKLESGEIEYGTEGAVNSLKTFIAEQLLMMVSLF